MEQTPCIFSSNNGECSGRKHSHLNHLICSFHLAKYFGLEIANSYIETPTETVYVGFNLKPVSDVFFRKNDIIVAEQVMVDKIYRSTQVVPTAEERIFRMNQDFTNFCELPLLVAIYPNLTGTLTK